MSTVLVSLFLLQGDGTASHDPETHYLRYFDTLARALARLELPIVFFIDESLADRVSYPNVRVEPITLRDCWMSGLGTEFPKVSTAVRDTPDYLRIINAKTFDLIVDDGAHEWDAQLLTLTNVYPHLRPDGLYVIEDIYRASPLVQDRHLIHDITGHQECLFVGREDPIAVIFAHPLVTT
jgi:SAM-dependent methyltransferase